MNDSGDIPLTTTHTGTPDTRPCSIISIIPTIGMSSCRGRAEAFARSLSSKLRTLGSQTNDDATNPEDEPIINGSIDNGASGGGGGGLGSSATNNTWISAHDAEQTVTDLQPLRHESDSFFDFECELESPGSPADECEYLRLIETASNTPHNSTTESGYACASAASSHSSSSDGPFYDANTMTTTMAINKDCNLTVTTQQPQRKKIYAKELPEYVNALKINGSNEHLTNGLHDMHEEHVTALTTSGTQTELPITGPDVQMVPKAVVAAAVAVVEECAISVQEKILNELQKQSEKYNVNLEHGLPLDTVEVKTIQQQQQQQHTTTIISNGHTEQGEDVLQIEMTDFEAQPSAEAITDVDTIDSGCVTAQLSIDIAPSLTPTPTATQTTTTDLVAEAAETTATTTAENNNANNNNHTLDTTDDEDDCRPQRVRRCSSLKTGKTPPGTPGRKKIVRFADVLGLDLADVKTFLDEIPTIPKSAFEDLEILEVEPPIQLGPKSDKMLMPLFQQPGGLAKFLDAVREKQVSLENAAVTDNINQTITGSVRVRNLDFNKSVHIRYTLDNWRSFADLKANYVENSCDGFSDKFTFILFGNSLHVGQRLEFAVRFQCKGQQFWDNNYGANYCFQCLPSSNHTTANATAASATTTASKSMQTSSDRVITTQMPPHHSGSSIVGLLSPTAGDAWCSSFY